jgi:DNA modification methylase
MTALPVHPFPARMAPELALERLPRRYDHGVTVLDPMMGSGTIPVTASLQGYKAIGFDIDPLAVIIARASGRSLDGLGVASSGRAVVELARIDADREFRHSDPETQQFIDRWFDPRTQRRLGALARAIRSAPPEHSDFLWCAFSRLIITKDAGASRARDVSHSRPHRVREEASFDPVERYGAAVEAVQQRHKQIARWRPPGDRIRLGRADARELPLSDVSVDVVLTSPPYLQAIDYLRGHRMSLVWMGHTVANLRTLRGEAIGTERGAPLEVLYSDVISRAAASRLPRRGERMVARYVDDLARVMKEISRVLKPSGRATIIVADGTVCGTAVSICSIVKDTSRAVSLQCIDDTERRIATANRYLPPPTDGGRNTLDKRMKVEHCLTFARV